MGLHSSIYKFLEYYITENIPEIRSVDLYFNQIKTDYSGFTDSLPNPRILIHILPIRMQSSIGSVQRAEVIVNLHICIDIFTTFNNLNAKTTEKNLEYLSLLDKIYTKLNRLSSYNLPDNIKSDNIIMYNVNREVIALANNTGQIKESIVTFRMVVEDYSYKTESIIGEVGTDITDNSLTLTLTV